MSSMELLEWAQYDANNAAMKEAAQIHASQAPRPVGG